MLAFVQDRWGGPETLKLTEVPRPVPDGTSVLVKVLATSINALDWRMMRGKPSLIRILPQVGFLRPRRRIRGVDVAGQVVEVRSPSSKFQVGDEVFGLGSGTFAEYVACDESELVSKPSALPYPEAAAIGVAGCTALEGLRDVSGLRPGQHVLINAVGSGVGMFTVQVAKWMGANVTVIGRTENLDLARSLGADTVLDSSKGDFTRGPDRFDLVFDISADRSFTSLKRILAPGGKICRVGARGGLDRVIKGVLLRRVLGYPIKGYLARPTVENLRQLGELVVEGRIRPTIDRRFSFQEIPAAMAYAEEHRVRGKIVISVP